MSIRIDKALVERGLCPTRENAQERIKAGLVTKNGAPADKCSIPVEEGDRLDVLGEVHPYVSRGALKLKHAIECFGIHCADRVCVDVGASTGGFTDVLLREGAQKVYAVDVGSGQLAPMLRDDPRVISMEHTNARTLSKEMFAPCPDLAVMDVSFISAKLILPALFSLLGETGSAVVLIKPQFEVGKSGLGKNGIVTDKRLHESVLNDFAAFPSAYGWVLEALALSPIKGTGGNIEYLAHFVPRAVQGRPAPNAFVIHKLVHHPIRSEK